jgi:hypothetical protein
MRLILSLCNCEGMSTHAALMHKRTHSALAQSCMLAERALCQIRQPRVNEGAGMLMTVVLVLHIILSELTMPWLPMPDSRKPWNGKWSGPLAGGPLICTEQS